MVLAEIQYVAEYQYLNITTNMPKYKVLKQC